MSDDPRISLALLKECEKQHEMISVLRVYELIRKCKFINSQGIELDYEFLSGSEKSEAFHTYVNREFPFHHTISNNNFHSALEFIIENGRFQQWTCYNVVSTRNMNKRQTTFSFTDKDDCFLFTMFTE